jgi:sugar lactone lactonase YvrE
MMKLTRRAALGAAVAAAAACAKEKPRNTDTAAVVDSAAAPATGAAAGAAGAGGGATYAKVATVAGFKTPESVKYDPDLDVYFVSNINGNPSQKDGNGFISRVRPDGTIDSLGFIEGGKKGVTLNAPKGMAVVGDTLVVADIDAVRMFNKRTGAPIASVELGKMKAHFLNDVAVGPDGALYVTDTGIQFGPTGQTSHPGPDQIFRIAGRTPSVAVADSALEGPNGIAWDQANGRFVVGSFAGKSLLTWKPGDAKAATLATGPGQFDGVEVVGGHLLASSWADSTVSRYDAGREMKVVTGVPSPADIGVDTKRNRLLVPIFTGDRVEIFEIR